ADVAVDFDARSLRIVRRKAGAGPNHPASPIGATMLASPMNAIEVEERTFADDADPLREEIGAFVRAVGEHRGGRETAAHSGITGREALVAVELAERVRVAIAAEAGRAPDQEPVAASIDKAGRQSTGCE